MIKDESLVTANIGDLTGRALCFAVVRALGYMPTVDDSGVSYRSDHGSWVYPDIENAKDAAEIMDREWIGLERPNRAQKTPMWRAITDSKRPAAPGQSPWQVVEAYGETSFLAGMRAFGISRLGKTIELDPQLLLPAPSKTQKLLR